MQGLLLRLSALDATAENGVRIISFFDALVARRVDIPTLVREASTLAECPVGIAVDETPMPESATHRRLPGGGAAWIDRRKPASALDELLLERLAIAAAILLDRTASPPAEVGDAALVELALSAGAGEAERARALRLLGIRPQAPLTVLALAAATDQARRAAAALDGHVAELGPWHVLLAPGQVPALDLEPGMRAGIAPVRAGIEAPAAWVQARTAVRFTDADHGLRTVQWADLGALAVLAGRLRREDIAEVADVAALDRIAEEPTGQDTLDVLVAYCASDSIRKAATAVYRHHSTITARLAHAEAQLGFPLSTTAGRLRLDLALILRHLRATCE